MSSVAVRTEGLSKRYRIGEREPYRTLRESIAGLAHAPLRWLAGFPGPAGRRDAFSEFIWALKDVSFEVKQGEAVGIIGANGAGKSTLLKILSRITEPTEGKATIHGRVGSLLEVGTGFHPELTGRENIYLNGAILGMKKKEIDRKFDEIVDFAEVEKFIDTPVKHYSSGMYTRLAFSVAAHLEPEILVVDEVLAVGDAAFQKKCLGKMGDVAQQGRTVIFVSHNMAAVERLCSRCILLKDGEKADDDISRSVIAGYLKYNLRSPAIWCRSPDQPWPDVVAFQKVTTLGKKNEPAATFAGNDAIRVQVEYIIRRPISRCQIGIRVNDQSGVTVMSTSECDLQKVDSIPKEPGRYLSSFEIPGNLLVPGSYSIHVAAHAPMEKTFEVLEDVVGFEVTNAGSLTALDGRLGLVAPSIPWQVLRTG
ncbi:MAG TPA: ABC transporter ATP-binding protein [candidate division Zixibacteria bacterium]|nr:ABC transporter ATP-binding protein [candidate division Zixibacteria bacterium]